MRAVAAGPGASGRRVRGGWLWGVSGVVTAAAVGVPAIVGIGKAGMPGDAFSVHPQHRAQRTVAIAQPVDAVTVTSGGAPVRIATGAVPRVEVTETIGYDGPGGPPSATVSVSGGRLALADPACADPGADCWVAFSVIAPRAAGVTVASSGGPVVLAGVTGARVNSGGGPVTAQQVSGPLTVTSEGGPVEADGVTGTLNVDSGGGPVIARDLTTAEATVTSEGGPATLGFAAAPRSVTVRSGGGSARLGVPGGPYALTADSGGGLESVEIATDPAAPRSLTVSSEGGPLLIGPEAAGGPAVKVFPPGGPALKVFPPAPGAGP